MIFSLVLGGLYFNKSYVLKVEATTIKDVQQQIENTKQEIAGLNDKIDALSDEQYKQFHMEEGGTVVFHKQEVIKL